MPQCIGQYKPAECPSNEGRAVQREGRFYLFRMYTFIGITWQDNVLLFITTVFACSKESFIYYCLYIQCTSTFG